MNKEEFKTAHSACPICGAADINSTLVGAVELDGEYCDELSTAQCGNCGWSGRVIELIPATTDKAGLRKPIRVLDLEGETYVNTKDTITAMLQFNAELAETIGRDDVKLFASALFKEITRMLIGVDVQHWQNRVVEHAAQNPIGEA